MDEIFDHGLAEIVPRGLSIKYITESQQTRTVNNSRLLC